MAELSANQHKHFKWKFGFSKYEGMLVLSQNKLNAVTP